MRSISRELHLPLSAPAAFALLHTPSAIRVWWSAARLIVAARAGGLWVGAWGADEDVPDYITSARILVWEPPHRLGLGQFEYFTRDGRGLPFAADLETEFCVRAQDEHSVLSVRQAGFPDDPAADAFFASCEAGWTATLDGIRRFVADGSRAAGR